MSVKAPLQRHRFEPARLLLGLALLGIATLYLLRTFGERGGPPLWVLGLLLPCALLVSGIVAAVTVTVRRARARRHEDFERRLRAATSDERRSVTSPR
ncbi:hypothetical protein ACTWP5_18240 [Streptomyces sp. 4N509B]|uniref:hypothetical protein n=1 Tax=Streptomyces sp. 4N509B TaxID=3457413 RepID=UPI003FD2620B